jgi:archaellum component FlaC
LNNTISYLR